MMICLEILNTNVMVAETDKEKPGVSPFGVWLKEKRLAKGFSQRKLAAEAHEVCSYGYISMLESPVTPGKKGNVLQPDEQIVEGLAIALGESVNEALTLARHQAKDESFREAVAREFSDALHRYHELSDHAREFAQKHFAETIEFLLQIEHPPGPKNKLKGGKKLKKVNEKPASEIYDDNEQ